MAGSPLISSTQVAYLASSWRAGQWDHLHTKIPPILFNWKEWGTRKGGWWGRNESVVFFTLFPAAWRQWHLCRPEENWDGGQVLGELDVLLIVQALWDYLGLGKCRLSWSSLRIDHVELATLKLCWIKIWGNTWIWQDPGTYMCIHKLGAEHNVKDFRKKIVLRYIFETFRSKVVVLRAVPKPEYRQ